MIRGAMSISPDSSSSSLDLSRRRRLTADSDSMCDPSRRKRNKFLSTDELLHSSGTPSGSPASGPTATEASSSFSLHVGNNSSSEDFVSRSNHNSSPFDNSPQSNITDVRQTLSRTSNTFDSIPRSAPDALPSQSITPSVLLHHHDNSTFNPRQSSKDLVSQKLPSTTFSSTSKRISSNHPDILVSSLQSVDNRFSNLNASLRFPSKPSKRQVSFGVRTLMMESNCILTQTNHYTIKRISSLPDPIASSTDYNASISLKTRHALATTSSSVWLWKLSSSPIASISFKVFDIPNAESFSKVAPLSRIAASQVSEDFGLLLIAPLTGRIQFWDNIDKLESQNLFHQHRQSLQSNMGNLLNGEKVVDIVDAELAGFIVVLSSGRLAQLRLWDSLGQPSICVQFLRTTTTASGPTGFLSGLKSVFSGGLWRHDLSGVRIIPSPMVKGQMEVVVSTLSGSFLMWTINWIGGPTFLGETRVQTELLTALTGSSSGLTIHAEPSVNDAPDKHIELIDFGVLRISIGVSAQFGYSSLPLSKETREEGLDYTVLCLARVGDANSPVAQSYHLIELVVSLHHTAVARRVITLRVDTSKECKLLGMKPRLLIPLNPHPDMTFVLFHNALVVCSLADREESPEMQLLLDARNGPSTFQDTIYFHTGAWNVCVIASAEENRVHKTGSCQLSCILLWSPLAGILRISAGLPATDKGEFEVKGSSALTKLEQAVFYGAIRNSPIDFSNTTALKFLREEVEEAALKLSDMIVSSSTFHINQARGSVGSILQHRAGLLNDLIRYSRQLVGELSVEASWKLMGFAEKVAACQQLFSHVEEDDKDFVLDDREDINLNSSVLSIASCKADTRSIIPFLSLLTKLKECPGMSQVGINNITEEMSVECYKWFTTHIGDLQALLPYGLTAFEALSRNCEYDKKLMLKYAGMTCFLFIKALDAAIQFRLEHCAMYGIRPESLWNGILREDDTVGVGIWTSDKELVKSLGTFVDVCEDLLAEAQIKLNDETQEDESLQVAMERVGRKIVRLVNLNCLCHVEQYRNLAGIGRCKGDMGIVRRANELKKIFNDEIRYRSIVKFKYLPLPLDGLGLADRFEDMRALVELLRELIREVKERRRKIKGDYGEGGRISDDLAQELLEDEKRLSRLFERFSRKFGTRFTDVYFNEHLREGEYYALVAHNPLGVNPELLKFFRENGQKLARLRWMYEITSAEDYLKGAESLLEAAQEREVSVWYKKIELSLAKLSLLATSNGTNSDSQLANEMSSLKIDRGIEERDGLLVQCKAELELTDIQGKVRQHVLGSFAKDRGFSNGNLEEMGMELVKKFGKCIQQRKPVRNAHQQLLKVGLEQIAAGQVCSVEVMVDVLTLMDKRESIDMEMAQMKGLCRRNNNEIGVELLTSREIDELGERDIQGCEFYLALLVIGLDYERGRAEKLRSEVSQGRSVMTVNERGFDPEKDWRESLVRVVWKRCILEDDWEELTKNILKGEQTERDLIRGTHLFQTLVLCHFQEVWFKAKNLKPPAEVRTLVGAGTSEVELKRRFSETDLLRPIIKDNLAQDNELEAMLAKGDETYTLNKDIGEGCEKGGYQERGIVQSWYDACKKLAELWVEFAPQELWRWDTPLRDILNWVEHGKEPGAIDMLLNKNEKLVNFRETGEKYGERRDLKIVQVWKGYGEGNVGLIGEWAKGVREMEDELAESVESLSDENEEIELESEMETGGELEVIEEVDEEDREMEGEIVES